MLRGIARLSIVLLVAAACAEEARRRPGSESAPAPADSGPRLDAGPGTDAGPTDAGLLDAGPADSGPSDAGPADSGPIDAGLADAGPADAGPADSGPNDSGPADAGPRDAGPADAGPTCSTKYDCPDGKVCKNNRCADPAADGRCVRDSDCARGMICNPESVSCIEGCIDPRDCAPEGLTCDSLVTPTYVCDVCHEAENPCPSGQACIDQECHASTTCTQSAQCGGGLVCNMAGVCANCTADGQCPGGASCIDGHCTPGVVCGTDGSCQSALGNPRAYCDVSREPDTCAVGDCNSDTHCNQAGGEVCDVGAHTCYVLEECQAPGDCPFGETCVADSLTGRKWCTAACWALAACLCPNHPTTGAAQFCIGNTTGFLNALFCSEDGYCSATF